MYEKKIIITYETDIIKTYLMSDSLSSLPSNQSQQQLLIALALIVIL